MIPNGAERPRDAHIWERKAYDHYVEPSWVSKRLFDEERFDGSIWDPACGFGRITDNAVRHGYRVWRSDIAAHGPVDFISDFLTIRPSASENPDNIVTNPPFELFKQFAMHALYLATHKVAMIWTVRTLPAARWLEDTPLRRVLLLTPRPSMPPGHVIASGVKPGGGTSDFCWLIWECGFRGTPTMSWLKRDGNVAADKSVINHAEDTPSNH